MKINNTNKSFKLSISQLKEISNDLKAEVQKGLAINNQNIQCIPTYISPTNKPTNGDCYVIDLGGTNIRAAVVNFNNGNFSIVKEPVEKKMPWQRGIPLDTNTYLDIQAQAIASLNYNEEIPLGYCFSFPTQTKENADASLIKFAKGVVVPNVVGKDVGKLLLDYLNTNYKTVKCSKVVVLNDTITSLLAGLIKPNVDACIGLIVGTGNNMATFINDKNIPKLKSKLLKGDIPVNLESGNFSPKHLTIYDHQVDLETENKGTQLFEKAVSGAYMANILKKAQPNLDVNEKDGAKAVVNILNNQTNYQQECINISLEIYQRSAKLVAASLAGLIDLLNSNKSIKTVRIVAEGSLFWSEIDNKKEYLNITKSTLEDILESLKISDLNIEFVNIKNANFIGCAIGCLS